MVCLILAGHMRTFKKTFHSISNLHNISHIIISTYESTDYTSSKIRRTNKSKEIHFYKIDINDVYNTYDSLSDSKITIRIEPQENKEFKHKNRLKHFFNVANFLKPFQCDIYVWTRPDVRILKEVFFLNNKQISIDNRSISTINTVITSSHRLSKINPQITDWFMITTNIHDIFNNDTADCDPFPKHMLPSKPERFVMNRITNTGKINIPIDNLAIITRSNKYDICEYKCKNELVTHPIFVCNPKKQLKHIDIGTFNPIWNEHFRQKMDFAIKNYDIIKFDIAEKYRSWSWHYKNKRQVPLLIRPKDKTWNWNSFSFYSHKIFDRLLWDTSEGMNKFIHKRMQEIAPYCAVDFEKNYTAVPKLYRKSCSQT